MGRFNKLSGTIVPAAPPVNAKLNFDPSGIPPPKSSMISFSVKPNGASNKPGRFTWPSSRYNFVPGVAAVEIDRYHGAPLRIIDGTAEKVSTLLTTVGKP